MKRVSVFFGLIFLLALASVGWYVLLVQKPNVLLVARQKYNQAVLGKIDFSSGPCLGKITDDWVLDIAHLPREPIDDLLVNQCSDYLAGNVHHFVEMSPQGEIIVVQ